MYTDGYTCRISFCKKIHPSSPVSRTSLQLNDFNNEEIDRYFRPCAVDPGRKDVFTLYHGNTDIRRLSSAGYYNIDGNINRQRKEQDRKKRLNVEAIETRIPLPKTASINQYTMYITYMLQHMEVLFNFYNFNTARINWCNYIDSQRAVENAVNIFINGSKKYNKKRRRNTKRNKKRRKTASKYERNSPGTHPKTGKKTERYYTYS
jgi:hypothetical protein